MAPSFYTKNLVQRKTGDRTLEFVSNLVVANSQNYNNNTTPTNMKRTDQVRAAEALYTYNALFTPLERLQCCDRGTTQVAGYKLLLFLYDGRDS